MGNGMVAASCVILIDPVIQIVSSFPRPVPVPGLAWVSMSAQRLTNREFRLLCGCGTPHTPKGDLEVPAVWVGHMTLL